MAEERAGTRESEFRRTYSWTHLLRTFLVALDPFKLLVAAVGILATSIGWWFISVIFWNSWNGRADSDDPSEKARYEFMAELAGPGGDAVPPGKMRGMPWSEDRGPNPYYLAKGVVAGTPEERHDMTSWFFRNQAPNLVEPLRKFLSPIIGMFDPRGNFWTRLFLFLALLWLLVVWAFCGGVITRMAVLQLGGKEGGGLREAVRFVAGRYLSYLFSPLVPIGIILAVVLGCILFGFVHLIPVVGDLVDGLFWWIPLGAGFVMALLLVGLVGYPLMYTTLSTEGSDTFDALSRSYNYVYESPWNYLWYSFVAVVYGAVIVLFVVFMSSLTVYLSKWGVAQTPGTEAWNASPDYLMIYAPKSYGWRQLLLEGGPLATDESGNYRDPQKAADYLKSYKWIHHAAAGMVAFWLTALFMLMLGFSYSYFWTAASMIYLLMRKKVDETDIDEIYIEDEEPEEPVAAPKATPPAGGPTQMVEAPSLRVTSTPPTPAEPPAVPEPPATPMSATPSVITPAGTEMTAPSPSVSTEPDRQAPPTSAPAPAAKPEGSSGLTPRPSTGASGDAAGGKS